MNRRHSRVTTLVPAVLVMVVAALGMLVAVHGPALVGLDAAVDLQGHLLGRRHPVAVAVAVLVTEGSSPLTVNLVALIVALGLIIAGLPHASPRRLRAAVYLVVARRRVRPGDRHRRRRTPPTPGMDPPDRRHPRLRVAVPARWRARRCSAYRCWSWPTQLRWVERRSAWPQSARPSPSRPSGPHVSCLAPTTSPTCWPEPCSVPPARWEPRPCSSTAGIRYRAPPIPEGPQAVITSVAHRPLTRPADEWPRTRTVRSEER